MKKNGKVAVRFRGQHNNLNMQFLPKGSTPSNSQEWVLVLRCPGGEVS
jgi:hypothetical protein